MYRFVSLFISPDLMMCIAPNTQPCVKDRQSNQWFLLPSLSSTFEFFPSALPCVYTSVLIDHQAEVGQNTFFGQSVASLSEVNRYFSSFTGESSHF